MLRECDLRSTHEHGRLGGILLKLLSQRSNLSRTERSDLQFYGLWNFETSCCKHCTTQTTSRTKPLKADGEQVKPAEPQRIEQTQTQPKSEPQHEHIDSSEFFSLSYEEVAALRPSDPEDMWAVVKKTCDRNREWKLDSVKNRRGWKTIRLFVSSTFRDFHAEREVLVKEVSAIPFSGVVKLKMARSNE